MRTAINCEIFIRTVASNILMFSTLFVAFGICYPIAFLPTKIVRNYWFVPVANTLTWIIENIAGIRCNIEGADRITSNVIFASRHESMWETIYLVSLLGQSVFILKKELVDIPLFGRFLKKVGMIDIDRKKGVQSIITIVREAEKAIKAGFSIVIFPEGTRSAPTASFKPKSGIAFLYEKLNVPVVPIALNSGDFWGRRSFWKKPGTVTLRLLQPIESGLDKNIFIQRLTDSISLAEKEIHN